MSTEEAMSVASAEAPVMLPRVTIRFCTQCKWMLRAAYFAQELLSTFSTALGEVALQPSTGGVFVVTIAHLPQGATTSEAVSHTVLWDRKQEGGFPETKELKRRVRDIIQPGRDLGHVDRNHPKPSESGSGDIDVSTREESRSEREVIPPGISKETCEPLTGGVCEDCT